MQVTPPLPTVLATCPVVQFEVSLDNIIVFMLRIWVHKIAKCVVMYVFTCRFIEMDIIVVVC